jgi:hypothetical protein
MNQSTSLLNIKARSIYGAMLRQNIITSRLELEEYQDTGERAIRWLKRYSQKPSLPVK